MLSLAVSNRFSSTISLCNSSNKPRSSSVIALYNTDHRDDVHVIAGDDDLDPDRVSKDDPDPDCDLELDPVSANVVIVSPAAPC